jgi:hypothetical protein
MARFWAGLILLMTVVAADAQPRRAVDELLDRVKGLPPEFAADLILQVELIVDKLPREQQIEMYEQAFQMAAHAELETPLQGRGFHTDTRPGWQERASGTGLDSLSLQYRAMLRMKALDPSRLQRMFRDMRPLDLKPQSCRNALRPELSKWAAAIGLVYQSGFTAEERAKEKDIAFVEDQVRTITSPLQLAQVLNIAPGDRRLLPRMSAAYDAAFAQARGDWFAFEYATIPSVRRMPRPFATI